jgi:hypothetical protein
LDNSGVGAARFRAPALKLFGRLTSHYVSESKLWRLYAKLVAGTDADASRNDATQIDSSRTSENAFKAAQLMQKALGSAVQAKDWSKNHENCIQTLNLASETIDCEFAYCTFLKEIFFLNDITIFFYTTTTKNFDNQPNLHK